MKKAISVILCAVLAALAMVMPVSAEDVFSTPSKSTAAESAQAAVAGVDYVLSDDGKTIDVLTADGYVYAVKLTNSAKKIKTLNLMANLDFVYQTGYLVPMFYNAPDFTFNGNGHTMKNVSIDNSEYNDSYYAGLFRVADRFTISDLTIESGRFNGGTKNGVGAIVGVCGNYGNFTNIHIKDSIIQGYGKVGAMMGFNAGSGATYNLVNCSADGCRVSAVYNSGGLIGHLKYNDTVNYENISVTNDEFFKRVSADQYITLNTHALCDGSAASCPGLYAPIDGDYWIYSGYYWAAYGKYWSLFGKTSHDCDAYKADLQIANSELNINNLGDYQHARDYVSAVPATCVSTGVAAHYLCSCGAIFSVDNVLVTDESTLVLPIDPNNHAGEIYTEGAVSATCSKEGYSGDSYCTECGKLVESGDVVPPMGADAPADKHDHIVTVPGKAPTCTEDGYGEYLYCDYCETIITEPEVIPATGHTPATAPGKEPTCTEDGYTEHQYCEVCGADITEPEVIPALGHTDADGDEYCDVCDEGLSDFTKFRCKMCRTYLEHKDIPVIGLFYRLVHFFVHLGHYIGYIT